MIACVQIEVASQEMSLTWSIFFAPGMSAVGQQRKSVEVAGMSAPGGKADNDFGRPDVSL